MARNLAAQFALPTKDRDLLAIVTQISDGAQVECEVSLELWRRHTSRYVSLDTSDDLLAPLLHLDASTVGLTTYVFQIYCVAVIEAIGRGLEPLLPIRVMLPDAQIDPFSAVLTSIQESCPVLDRLVAAAIAEHAPTATLNCADVSEAISIVYQELVAPEVRHLLGEYYTPPWLVQQTLTLVPQLSADNSVVFDPAVGSGTFLCHAVDRALDDGCSHITAVGADVNLVAIRAASISIAPHRALAAERGCQLEVELHWADPLLNIPANDSSSDLFRDGTLEREYSLLGGALTCELSSTRDPIVRSNRDAWLDTKSTDMELLVTRYADDVRALARLRNVDLCVGNPPWITWDGLTDSYRDLLSPIWRETPLMTQRGWRARVAAGKTDVSSLFVYACAERYGARGSDMAFVLPLSLFTSRHAALGFRKFRTSSGRHYAPTHVSDFSQVRVFKDAANRTCVAAFRLDDTPGYPFPGIEWRLQSRGDSTVVGHHRRATRLADDEDGSPIVMIRPDEMHKLSLVGASDYRARGGVNTGGANTILWVDVVEERSETLVVRNVGKTMRSQSAVHEGEIEKEFVHPMLRGADVRRWQANPSGALLLCYDKSSPKQALPEQVLAQRAPRTLAYLSKFEDALRARKEFIRWGAKGPFYEVYRIGPYTFAPNRVVWQHTGFQGLMRCAVIPDECPRPIPDQKVILVAAESAQEAHYICAIVNSDPIGWILRTYLGTDASTHVLDYARVKRFDPANDLHIRLASNSQAAHERVASGEDVSELEREIDELVMTLSTKQQESEG